MTHPYFSCVFTKDLKASSADLLRKEKHLHFCSNTFEVSLVSSNEIVFLVFFLCYCPMKFRRHNRNESLSLKQTYLLKSFEFFTFRAIRPCPFTKLAANYKIKQKRTNEKSAYWLYNLVV